MRTVVRNTDSVRTISLISKCEIAGANGLPRAGQERGDRVSAPGRSDRPGERQHIAIMAFLGEQGGDGGRVPGDQRCWATTKGAVGIRVILRDGLPADSADPGVTRAFAAAARHGLPVNFLCWGHLDLGSAFVRRNPDTVIVIDHLGLLQPNKPPVPAEPWAELPKLLALAACPNVRVKISGACTMSHQPYPYGDIWDPVLKIIDEFGVDRCMWGTDWTRTIGMLTYEQAVAPFRETTRLSASDKAKLMGGTLEKVYNWHRW